MRIHVDQIKEGGISLFYSEPAESFEVLADMIANEECEFRGPIETRLTAFRIADLIKVDGTLNASVRLACDRCLEAFYSELKGEFSLTYTRDVYGNAPDEEEEIELSEDDLGLIAFQGEEIDFREAVQEQVILAFPLRALCRETCKGLCPRCGTDLNKTSCACTQVIPASKFAALRELKLKE